LSFVLSLGEGGMLGEILPTEKKHAVPRLYFDSAMAGLIFYTILAQVIKEGKARIGSASQTARSHLLIPRQDISTI
jgi:hypothetical protein